MTDAAHLLVDFASFIISLVALWLSSRPATRTLSYGWHRAGEIIILIIIVVIIVIMRVLHTLTCFLEQISRSGVI